MVLINIEKLELNKEYTWKEICNLVGIKYSTDGKTRARQLEELKQYAEVVDNGKTRKAKKYIIKNLLEQNLSNYTTIESNSNILEVNIDKNNSNKNKNEHDVSLIDGKPLYYESEDEDELFFQIERNKHKLVLYRSYTYKKLTEILEIKYHGSSVCSKDSQLTSIAQQIQLLKDGNKYKVLRIYRVPLDRKLGNVDMNNRQLYGNMLIFAMVKYIVENPNARTFLDQHNYMYFGRPFLYEQMELCNEKYNEFRYNYKELHEETKVDKDTIIDFYHYTNGKMKDILQKALKNLSTRHIIRYDDKNATCIVDKDGNRRIATHEEIGLITQAEYEVKKELGIKNLSVYISQGKGKYFYDKVNQYIRKQIKDGNKKYSSFGKNFDKCYKVVLIYVTTQNLENGYKELIDDIELSLINSNDNFVDINLEYFNNTDIEKKQIVTTKGFGKEAHEKSVFEAKYEYLQGIYLLLEKLIKCKPISVYKEA
ncbi:MAG: hypothetical protein SOT71_05730 [Romboutsia timonensis]|uniref:hypothetical protein n=1 Tax=Romboutsia timonensis TaxID=1776391 RepID=UPI002A7547DC|nr:hypothetical protein [Romboutsia timonensis]MDY2882134.1 hypothetical protein [Romboutsia timonensis]